MPQDCDKAYLIVGMPFTLYNKACINKAIRNAFVELGHGIALITIYISVSSSSSSSSSSFVTYSRELFKCKAPIEYPNLIKTTGRRYILLTVAYTMNPSTVYETTSIDYNPTAARIEMPPLNPYGPPCEQPRNPTRNRHHPIQPSLRS